MGTIILKVSVEELKNVLTRRIDEDELKIILGITPQKKSRLRFRSQPGEKPYVPYKDTGFLVKEH